MQTKQERQYFHYILEYWGYNKQSGYGKDKFRWQLWVSYCFDRNIGLALQKTT